MKNEEYIRMWHHKYLHEPKEESARLRVELLNNIRNQLPNLKELFNEINKEGIYEQLFYRFHYGSFKVYSAQEYTLKIVQVVKDLLPGRDFSPSWHSLITQGTGKKFDISVNDQWEEEPLQILTAFLHMRHFLEMLIQYGETLDNPEALPYGWATILLLYGLR